MSTFHDVEPALSLQASPGYEDRNPRFLRLDQNTNSRVNPCVARAQAAAKRSGLNQYGSSHGARLRARLARFYGISEDRLIVGNGADEIIDLVAHLTLGPGRKAAMFVPGYEIYSFVSHRQGATLREIQLDPRLRQHLDKDAAGGIDTLWLSSPHNPTGTTLSRSELLRISSLISGLVVLDEAYAEYAGTCVWRKSVMPSNVLFIRTFSKAWGLAGLRVGYGVGSPEIVSRLASLQIPYTLGTFAEELACEALREKRFLKDTIAEIKSERSRMTIELTRRGFTVFPSDGDFLLTYPPLDGDALYAALRAKGILLKCTGRTAACERPVRVSIRGREENDRFLEGLDRTLEGVLR